MTRRKFNWSNYNDIYDIYKNGTKIKRIWGKKHALNVAESQSGELFGESRIDVVNIYNGEVIWSN